MADRSSLPLDNDVGGMPTFSSTRRSPRIPRVWSTTLPLCRSVRCSTLLSAHLASSSSPLDDQQQRMPLAVQRSVRKQNIKFLHNRIHFSPEYFLFMKKLVQNNVQLLSKSPGQAAENSELLLTIMQITTKFLFSIGWRTKKNLRSVLFPRVSRSF